MPQSGKYGRVSFEKGAIPEGEMVFVLRARDPLACKAVRKYADFLEKAGKSSAAAECRAFAKRMSDWPDKRMPN